MSDEEFLRQYAVFATRNGWPPSQGPWSAVERWELLVDQAVAGYEWGFYEFTNELSARDQLARLFDDRDLAGFEQVEEMRARVRDADSRLQSTFRPDHVLGAESTPWWKRGVLARAGDEYCEDVKRLFGIVCDADS